MEMEAAKEIRDTLDKIDYYKNKLRELRNCVKLDVTIYDGKNGRPTSFRREDIEVNAIIKAYEFQIELLNSKITHIKVVSANE